MNLSRSGGSRGIRRDLVPRMGIRGSHVDLRGSRSLSKWDLGGSRSGRTLYFSGLGMSFGLRRSKRLGLSRSGGSRGARRWLVLSRSLSGRLVDVRCSRGLSR